ncbi:MAG: hypothetical protein JXA30_11390 [Deltaproteobacteria bacterium]|nr:hypothetical protein [Deltaproteobacteria bacterium]
MTEKRIVLFCYMGVMILGACDGDDKNAASSPNHGVSGRKPLSSLTQEEIDEICEDNRERAGTLLASSPVIRDTPRVICTIAGLAFTINGGTKAECETTRNRCLETADRIVGDAGPALENALDIGLFCPTAASLAQCDVDVSLVDACTDARIAAYQRVIQETASLMNAISCDNAGQPFDAGVFIETGRTEIRIEPPNECSSLIQQCPGASLF